MHNIEPNNLFSQCHDHYMVLYKLKIVKICMKHVLAPAATAASFCVKLFLIHNRKTVAGTAWNTFTVYCLTVYCCHNNDDINESWQMLSSHDLTALMMTATNSNNIIICMLYTWLETVIIVKQNNYNEIVITVKYINPCNIISL